MQEEIIENAEETKNTENIESICRKYILKKIQEEPYDDELRKIKREIEGGYKESSENYKKNHETIRDTLSKFEKIQKEEDFGFFNGLKNRFIYSDNIPKYRLELREFGNSLDNEKEKIKSLESSINKCYNTQAEFINSLSDQIGKVEKIINSYESDLKNLEKGIRGLYGLHKDNKILREHVKKVVEEKEKDEKKLEEEEKEQVIEHLIDRGESELRDLSEKYLQTKNDINIAENLLSYKVLIKKSNKTADSLFSAKEKISEDLRKLNKVFLVYETIISPELDFLSDIGLPEGFVHAINRFVDNMEKVDQEFSDKCLENVFSHSEEIRIPGLSEVSHGLIKYVRENGS